jgi:molybdopterin/thiamine biosynthesis adenylyltransferase
VISEGNALLDEAKATFGLLHASVIHRTGTLVIGESAVLIQVAAPHRREAFAGCEWIIDQLKVRVPIWKRETYADGDSGWVGADAKADNSRFDDLFFERQMRLGEVGPEGQQKLKNTRVLLVGVGGLGSGCLPALVGAGIGSIGFVDGDIVELSNLHRQTIYVSTDVGRSKTERAAAFAIRLRPNVHTEVFPEPITEANVDKLVGAYGWIIDGTDSLEVKFLLNAACKKAGKPLVTASIHRFEGHIMTITPGGPCLNCLFPEPPATDSVGTCAEEGVMGVLPGIFGMLQANEVLKGILGYGDVLSHHLMTFDLRTGKTQMIERSHRDDCAGCRGEFSGMILSLDEARTKLGKFRLIDIRENPEHCLPVDHEKISAFDLIADPGDGPIVVSCNRGSSSLRTVQQLRKMGFSNVYSLRGGAEMLQKDIRD